VKLGFIDSVQVNDNDVTISFKLPTYWCAPNFAYLMAADLRNRVKAIPGVRITRILLLDHCTDEEVSANVNADKSFTEAFLTRLKITWKNCVASSCARVS